MSRALFKFARLKKKKEEDEERGERERERGWMVCHMHGTCISSGSKLSSIWAWN